MDPVELKASLSPDNQTVVLEMLVDGHSVGKLPLSARDMDYQIEALTSLRRGMAE